MARRDKTYITYCTHTTVQLRLAETAMQTLQLSELQRHFAHTLNVIAAANTSRLTNSVNLHHQVYHPFREMYPEVPASFVAQAIRVVAGTYKSLQSNNKRAHRALERAKYKKVPATRLAKLERRCDSLCSVTPTFKDDASVIFVKDTIRSTPDEVRATHTIKVSTMDKGRPITITLADTEYNRKQAAKLVGDRFSNAQLYRNKHGHWVMAVAIPHTLHTFNTWPVVGIDMGINIPLVTSERETTCLEEYDRYRARDTRIQAHVARLQSNGSKSALRRLRKTSGKRKRATNDFLHVLSNKILDTIPKDTKAITLENLSGIVSSQHNKKHKARIAKWWQSRLQLYIEYKAIRRGLVVVYVNPSYTSQMCSRCGSHLTLRDHEYFLCFHCGVEQHADANAAINIRNKAESILARMRGHIRCVGDRSIESSTKYLDDYNHDRPILTSYE